MMGLEEHLLGMFRDDFEFHADAAPSHLGHGALPRDSAEVREPVMVDAVGVEPGADSASLATGERPISIDRLPGAEAVPSPPTVTTPVWADDATRELGKIPFFVRGKARRNTERFAVERGVARITREVLYEAKAHYGR
jgi:light-independent protochlorophyllide reductase subunit B